MRSKSKYERKPEAPKEKGSFMVPAMVFASGFAGLVYQVLWMKQLGLLFGNTSYAAAATLAAFFAGLGAGSWWWGKSVSKSKRPFRLYAWLEFGIAISALTYFVVLKIFHAVYPSLYGSISGTYWMLLVKFALALLLVFPSAFFMGGTVPAIGQAAIRNPQKLGRTGAFLYGINTLGAALGVGLAAFLLIPSFGFSITYSLAITTSVVVGIISWRTTESDGIASSAKAEVINQPVPKTERIALSALCFFSGFVILALEVVWTRIFAQVHENSVYSFAIILIVVLVGLAIGAVLSSVIAHFITKPWAALGVMTMIGGVLLVLGPKMLILATKDLTADTKIDPWGDYVSRLFHTGFLGIGFVVIAMGTVFPFLMKLAEHGDAAPGLKLGKLLAINTAGSICGALLCGFVLLPVIGIWKTLLILSAMYLVVGLFLPMGWGKLGIFVRMISLGFLALLFTALNPTGHPVAGSQSGKDEGKLLQAWEESEGTVTAIKKPNGHISIKVNGSYGLGSTEVYYEQIYQSKIPLHLFPETESIFFLGFGTGISAGASLDKEFTKVRRVVSCELIPAVVEASQKWIPKEMTGGVFDDARATILIEDGRHFLRASRETFDMINADLFLPYQRGAGSLYSLEHYRVAMSRLNEGGVFVQWLPMYQLTEFEFGVITRTMLEAFGEVTMWRNNFQPGQEKIALIGRKNGAALPTSPLENREGMRDAVVGFSWQAAGPEMYRVAKDSMPFLYVGNITKTAYLFSSYPINTDDRPVIEYQTPITFRDIAKNQKVIWCVGPRLIALIDRIQEACPPAEDPIWAGHPASTQHLIKAGTAFHRAMVAKTKGDFSSADSEWKSFLHEWMTAAE